MDMHRESSENPARKTRSGTGCDLRETIPMHPDDVAGLLAWITAKRFGETIPEISAAEKYRFLQILG